MSNEASVQSALKLLSAGLDPHITKVLSPHLGSQLEWTDVLSELDAMKGKGPKIYSRNDVQCQLRAITERLGNLGYPFDAGDPLRTLSTFGNELRIVRNRWAHGSTFSTFEAMRAVDTVFIVLSHIGDAVGAEKAACERAALVTALIDEPFGEDVAETGETVPEEHEIPGEQGPGQPENRFASRRTEFEPWDVVVTGSVETLDLLPKKTAKEAVRATIEEIVYSEGPIHRDRLTKLVGYTFGLGKVHEARAKKILSQINASTCSVDKDQFVWPDDIDPLEWKIYRRSAAGSTRRFLEISPREICNAAADVLRASGPLAEANLRRKTLNIFGRTRSVQAFVAHFEKGLRVGLESNLFQYDLKSSLYECIS